MEHLFCFRKKQSVLLEKDVAVHRLFRGCILNDGKR